MKSRLYVTSAVLGMVIGLSSCDSGGTSSADSITSIQTENASFVQQLDKLGSTSEATSTMRKSSRFEFPSIASTNGNTVMSVPSGALPGFSARRTLERGTGPVLGYGDTVSLQYDMFSWATGQMVESTAQDGGNLEIVLAENSNVPEYLVDALLGKKRGEKMQVVFKPNMGDLPDNLNRDDAYILVVKGQ